MFAMNQTGKNCFFFEDKYVNFDRTEGVFTANIVTCSLNCLFSLVTCLGNFLIVFTIGKTQELHSPTFILLGCLAVSDLLVGLVCQPLYVAHKIAELEENFAVFCELKMVQFLSGWTTSGASFFILATVSIDRLLALTLHLRYNTIVTVPRVFQTTFILWMFVTVTVLLRFWMTNKWFFIPIGLGFLFFFVIMASSWKIFRIVRRHQHQVKDQDMAVSHLQNKTMNILKCRKSAATVLYIYGLFLIFYLPYMVLLVTETFIGFSRTSRIPTQFFIFYLPYMVLLLVKTFIGFSRTVRIAYDYAATAIFINSFLNPVLYCWRISEIRRAVKNIMRRNLVWSIQV